MLWLGTYRFKLDIMFEISAMTTIASPPQRVWEFLVDIQNWWLPSNPEHESLEILSTHDRLELGTKLRIGERVAGIPGEAIGSITAFVPGERATWVAKARYRLLWTRFTIDEGVTWSVRPVRGGSELRADVWAHFPRSFFGMLLELMFVYVLRGRDKDRQHAETELEYIRRELEKRGEGPGPS